MPRPSSYLLSLPERTLRALMTDPGCPLAQIATETGYFDQAHFIKDFKRMSGGVPRGYRGYFPPEGPSDFAPNVVVFLQDGTEDAPDDANPEVTHGETLVR